MKDMADTGAMEEKYAEYLYECLKPKKSGRAE